MNSTANTTTIQAPLAVNNHAVASLSVAFSFEIRATLNKKELAEVVRLNKAAGMEADWCHTHDFMDANMCMDAAFRKVFGVGLADEAPEAEMDRKFLLASEAWNMARQNDFQLSAI